MSDRRSCAFCESKYNITRHHLHPKSVSVSKLKATHKGSTIPLCNKCHSQVHSLFNEKQLAKNFYSLELLLDNPSIKKWIGFRRKEVERGKALDDRKKRERIRGRLVV